MSKQPESKQNGREPRRPDHDRLDGRIQTLYESSGHYGGWTMEEMTAAGFGPVYPKPEPEPEKPENLKKLAAAVDVALLAFDEADQAWQQAAREDRGGNTGPTLLPFDYSRIIDSTSPNRAKELERTERDRWKTREETGERLREAKIAFQAAEKIWLRVVQASLGEALTASE